MTAPALTVYVDGQGAVTADGLNTFEQTCDTVSDLRAFVGVTGQQVSVRGNSTISDSGQGVFYWSDTGTYTDNGSSIIVPSGVSQGAWVRLGYYAATPLGNTSVNTVTGAGQTLTAGQMLGGVLVRDGTGAGANFIDTTPTAAQLVAARTGAYPNLGVDLLLVVGGAYQQSLQAGTGVSLYGNVTGGKFVTAGGVTRTLKIVYQNVTSGSEAVQISG